MQKKSRITFALVAAMSATLLSACSGTTTVGPPPAALPPSAIVPAGDTIGGLANLTSGTGNSNKAPSGTGDWALPNGGAPDEAQEEKASSWVQITKSKAGDLNPVLVNGARLTLYRFDNDTANPSKSNCNDDCAKKWPPVVVKRGGKIFFAGVKRSAIGVVRRDDGRLQVTIGGWPAYRFAKDTQPGDTKGQGVGGTWFGLTPNGGKAGAQAGQPDSGQNNGGNADGDAPGSVRPATAVALFEKVNFDGSAEGLSADDVKGKGCVDANPRNRPFSLTANGRVKIWTDPGCKGTSAIVTEDVDDLSKLEIGGFGGNVGSVFFG